MIKKLIAPILLAIIIILFWMVLFYGRDEYEQATRDEQRVVSNTPSASTQNDLTVIKLTPQAQAYSGITTVRLQSAQYQTTLPTVGTVVALEPLLTLRAQYLTAQTEVQAAQNAEHFGRIEYERVKALYQADHNLSERSLNAEQEKWQMQRSKLEQTKLAARSIQDQMQQSWGEEIAALACQNPASPLLQALIAHRQALVLVVFPPDSGTRPNHIFITPIDETSPQAEARFYADAPYAYSNIPGKSYFYLVPVAHLRKNMPVTVHYVQTGQKTGVIIPDTAIVWHAGQAWVYIRQQPNQFMRQVITTHQRTPQGWFNSENVRAGTVIVNHGAQSLLSEEFKFQIKNENED